MQNFDIFLISMHCYLGHEKTAFYLGVSPDHPDDCLLCRYELTGADTDRLAIITALLGVRLWTTAACAAPSWTPWPSP